MKNSRHFVSLEIYRGLASLLVVLFHYHFYCGRYLGSYPALSRLFEGGHSGVEFFFVLSGFIIYHTHWNDIGASGAPANFIRRRSLRILPMYWIVITLSVASFTLFQSWGESKGLTLRNIIFDYFLLPTNGQLILSPAWTLKHEALFYALFCIMIFRPASGVALLCLWQATILATNIFALIGGWSFDNPYMVYLLDIHNIGFGIGVVCGAICTRSRVLSPHFSRLLLALGVASVGSLMIFESLEDLNFAFGQTFQEQTILSFLYVVGYSFIILGSVGIERKRKLTPNRVLLLLGASSYTLYLVHDPLASLLGKAARTFRLGSLLNDNAIYCMEVCIAVAIAAAVHLWVERPVTRLLKQALAQRRQIRAEKVWPTTYRST